MVYMGGIPVVLVRISEDYCYILLIDFSLRFGDLKYIVRISQWYGFIRVETIFALLTIQILNLYHLYYIFMQVSHHN